MDVDDAADIKQSLAGDGIAFGRLIERHQQQVATWMRRFARDQTTVEELVQDVFVEAYLSLATFRGAVPFRHWLSAIATRVGYRFWKRRARDRASRPFYESLVLANKSPFSAPAVETDSLDAVLAQLPPRDRLVVTLLYLEQHSVAETARLTGWSRAMVKVQAFRARRKLRRLMESRGTGL